MRRLFVLVVLLGLAWAELARAQSGTGELRLEITDPTDIGIKATVELTCEANQYRETYDTDDSGSVVAKRLPFGMYTIRIQRPGFAEFSDVVEIRSSLPVEFKAQLRIEPASTTVTVADESTLIDPYRTGTINRVGGVRSRSELPRWRADRLWTW